MSATIASNDADVYTIREAAEKLRCSIPAVREAIASGTIPAVPVGPHNVRIPGAAFRDLITKGAQMRDAPTPAATEDPQ